MSEIDAIGKGSLGAKIGGDPIRRDGAAWDISTYTVEVEWVKPDGTTTGTWTASVAGPDANGDYSAFYTTTAAGDLDEAGHWKYRIKVSKGGTELYRSKWKSFEVFD